VVVVVGLARVVVVVVVVVDPDVGAVVVPVVGVVAAAPAAALPCAGWSSLPGGAVPLSPTPSPAAGCMAGVEDAAGSGVVLAACMAGSAGGLAARTRIVAAPAVRARVTTAATVFVALRRFMGRAYDERPCSCLRAR
jgi:hypothetical protein